MAGLWLKWMSTAPCVMWKQLFACYLGDMLCSGGGYDNAIQSRCCVVWGKLRKLLLVLTSRHLSPRIRGMLYEACIRSAMLHGSETWGQNEPELRRLGAMTVPLSVGSMASKTRRNTLSVTTTETWYRRNYISLLLLSTQMARTCTTAHVLYEIYHRLSDFGTRKKGRTRKTCSEYVKTVEDVCGLAGVDPFDIDAWRVCIWHSPVLSSP